MLMHCTALLNVLLIVMFVLHGTRINTLVLQIKLKTLYEMLIWIICTSRTLYMVIFTEAFS